MRLVWNKTLTERHTAYHAEGRKTSYKQTDAALTQWKKTQDLAFLAEVSSAPLQQTLRHQHSAFANFFAGRALVVIDRWFPSSKTCSACGHLLATLSLGTRRWTCPACRTRHDRDVNAAKNTRAAGRAAARETVSGDACGAGVRRQGSSLPRSATKQETAVARQPA